jgi:hypothetical protein
MPSLPTRARLSRPRCKAAVAEPPGPGQGLARLWAGPTSAFFHARGIEGVVHGTEGVIRGIEAGFGPRVGIEPVEARLTT